MEQKTFEELGLGMYKERARAFIKVQEGCNQFCSYWHYSLCRVLIRSRSEENVIQEVKKLVDSGYREIVLTGIHIGSN